MHTLPDAEFLVELKNLNGTKSAVLENDDLMRILLPVLRADFTVHETWSFAEEPPLDCPILAVAGADDSLFPPAEMAFWRRHTRAAFESAILPGGHFFLQTHRPQLLELITRNLQP